MMLEVKATSFQKYAKIISWHIWLFVSSFLWRIFLLVFLELSSIALSAAAIFMIGFYFSDENQLVILMNNLISFNLFSAEIALYIPFFISFLYILGALTGYLASRSSIKLGADYTVILGDKICSFDVLESIRKNKLLNHNFNSTKELSQFSVRESRSGFVLGRLLGACITSIIISPILLVVLFYFQPTIALILLLFTFAGFPVHAYQSRRGAATKTKLRALIKKLIELRASAIDTGLNLAFFDLKQRSSTIKKSSEHTNVEHQYTNHLAEQRLVIENAGLVTNLVLSFTVCIFLIVAIPQVKENINNIPELLMVFYVVRVVFSQISKILKSLVAFNRFFPSLRKIYEVANSHNISESGNAPGLNQEILKQLNVFILSGVASNRLEVEKIISGFEAILDSGRIELPAHGSENLNTQDNSIITRLKSECDREYYHDLLRGLEGVSPSQADSRRLTEGIHESVQDVAAHKNCCSHLSLLVFLISCGAQIFYIPDNRMIEVEKLLNIQHLFRKKIVIVTNAKAGSGVNLEPGLQFGKPVCCSQYVLSGLQSGHECSLKSAARTSIDILDDDEL